MGSLCLKCPWASPSTLYGDTAFPSFNFFLELTTYLKYSPLNFTKEPFLQHYSPFTYKILHTLYEINAQLISLLLVFHYIYLSSIRAFTISFLFFFFLFFNCSLPRQDRIQCGTVSWRNSNQCKSHLAILSSQPSKSFLLPLERHPNKTAHKTAPDHHSQLTSHHSALSPFTTPQLQRPLQFLDRDKHSFTVVLSHLLFLLPPFSTHSHKSLFKCLLLKRGLLLTPCLK